MRQPNVLAFATRHHLDYHENLGLGSTRSRPMRCRRVYRNRHRFVPRDSYNQKDDGRRYDCRYDWLMLLFAVADWTGQ